MAEKPPAFLLDASALLAYLQKEPGFEAVREALREGAGISAVNLAEVVGKLKTKGKDPDRILRRLLAMGLEVPPFTLEAGALDPLTRPLGLFLGDRACSWPLGRCAACLFSPPTAAGSGWCQG